VTHMIRTMYYVGTLKTQITIFLIARLIDFQCAASNAASNGRRARRASTPLRWHCLGTDELHSSCCGDTMTMRPGVMLACCRAAGNPG